tara:strand:+ start:1211 stop:1813 length:603 start_codon:yes stop_codon:yes gene_type:complete
MSKIQANQIQHTQNGAAVFTLPTSDGSTGQVIKTDGSGALSFVAQPTAGITMADQWRINSNFNSQNEVISFNWERVDNSFAGIGTGMSYSSGVFSFPQTGIYYVEFHAGMYLSSDSARYAGINLQFTEDNSNYTTRAEGYGLITNNSTSYIQAQVKYILDISDISNRKVRFKTDSEKTLGYAGSSVENRTVATFIRLGDT